MNSKPHKTDEVLKHIGLHRLTLRCVLDRLFYGGHHDGCNNVIQRLLKQRRITRRDGLPGRLSYYQLSPNEAVTRGVPINRTWALGGQQLQTYLGVLWFCVMPDRQRRLLEPPQVRKMFPDQSPGGVHCLEAGEEPRLLRVRVVGAMTKPSSIVHDLRTRITDPSLSPKLNTAIRNRQYVFVVLAEFKQRRDAIDAAIERSGLRQLAAIKIAGVPGHQTIGEEIAMLHEDSHE